MGYGKLPEQAASGAERKAAFDRRARMVTRRQCADVPRRNRMEKDIPKWLRFYMGEQAFPFPFSDGHREIIHNADQAAINGTGAAAAAPRGEGKTTTLRGVACNLVARGVVRFPVLVGWKFTDAAEAYTSWLRMLCDSEPFKADYPELTQPFEISTHATSLKALMWADTETRIGANIAPQYKLIILPDSAGAVCARSAQGDAKGLNATLIDGTVLRPELLLIDDAQDPKQAHNPTAVAKNVDVLENVFMGMAGPQRRLTTFCACTVESPNDVSEHFLTRAGWASVRVSRIVTWPGGGTGGDWELEKNTEQRAMWEECNRIRLDEGEKQAATYYRKRKKAMVAGMAVSWKHRFDKERGEPDALYSAMREYYDKGADVFSRAQQNKPIERESSVYELSPSIIKSKVADRERYVVPDGTHRIIASTDLNPSYAFTSAVVAFRQDQGASVITYGLYRGADGTGIAGGDIPAKERSQKVQAALAIIGKELKALPFHIDMWAIDAGGADFKAVLNFADHSPTICGIVAGGATGRAAKKYRPYSKNCVQRFHESHIAQEDGTHRKWLVWQQHYWMEVAQRAWLGGIGAPGACDLFKAPRHNDFADQVCRVMLRGKGDLGGEMIWNYSEQPGPHDYADVMAQAFAAAAANGIDGQDQAGAPQQRRRRVKHVSI